MNSLITSLRSLCVALLCGLLLTSCSKSPPPPTLAAITFVADEKVNVDTRGRSTPVVVRYYLLKNDSAFNTADFFSLLEKDQATLGDAIVLREEFTLKPGETKKLDTKDAGPAQTLAVFVQYRNIDRATWRSTTPLTPHKANDVSVSLKNDQITLAGKSR
ncbi:type VI secretion system lipoprotein TssJ [Uliginosibacterium sp. H3]|uniref:Type VI secretion system lipoprotein TssJ n=1 Tax=Uliginosibacterium silvisoli TaxID=3114758 RepID=A0ABU6K548_9RHOO|nr:type VI secretion system lipoprotein TssJ [Uliginosibacterium sp. H3]